MYKLSRLLSCISFILVTAWAVLAQQGTNLQPNFDIKDFNEKFETVKWLVAYDEVAWKTSDVVVTEDKAELSKLGREWFCIEDTKGVWHAFYGKLENDKFVPVFHYVMDGAGKISRSTESLGKVNLDAYAKALSTANAKLQATIPASSPVFNQYLKQNGDGTFGVWMLPAFSPDGTAVFGGEAYYTVDGSGSKILKEESYFQPGFKGFKATPPREIWLNYRELQKPTLGTIFFVWYYKSYFTNINIDNSGSVSTVIKDGNNYLWVHVMKDQKATKP